MTTRTRRMGRCRALAVSASIGTAALLGACGSSGGGAAARATSIEAALGLDESAIEEREAKVQEEVRKCMQAEGFEYVPMDPSRLNVKIVGPGSEDTPEFRRTKGYGITTTFGERPADDEGSSDPNREIREAMSEEDREAYDRALFGAGAQKGVGGGFSVQVGPGEHVVGDVASAPDPSEMGCFGKAQEAVGDGHRTLERVGPQLKELHQRIESDARMVRANAAWAACMSDAGFDFETPEDIPPYLFEKIQELQASLGGGDDGVSGRDGDALLGPPDPEAMEELLASPEMAALQREELALAAADDGCSESTGRRETARKVRAEAEKQFLEDNPDLGAGAGED